MSTTGVPPKPSISKGRIMQADKKTVRTSRGQREYTCLGCPLTRNRTAWCFRLCTPDSEGNGRCGRIAPHSLKGRTQLSIEHYSKNLLDTHWEKLERLYLGAPCNEYFDPGVRIAEGEAEVVVPIQDKFFRVGGDVHSAIGFTAMVDSAALAVNSMVEKALVVPVNFDTQLTCPLATGELIARSRFLGMSGDHYLAESVMTDSEGRELGRGKGAFKESDISLSADIGYV
jgi:acyl-coenzyme A thioesterase PaaI-like protein